MPPKNGPSPLFLRAMPPFCPRKNTIDVLGDVYTNGDLTMVSGKKVEDHMGQAIRLR